MLTMSDKLRWDLTGVDGPQLSMFPESRREVGIGEYRGLEFYEVMAKSIINKVPGPPRFGFQHTVNPYRGCSHACTYCFARPTSASVLILLKLDPSCCSRRFSVRSDMHSVAATVARSGNGGSLEFSSPERCNV